MRRRSEIAHTISELLLILALFAACGDIDFAFVARTGTVVEDADCPGPGGSFDLRDQRGLTILVVITDDTDILFATGGRGMCPDITGGTHAEVRGEEQNGTMEAESVRLGTG